MKGLKKAGKIISMGILAASVVFMLGGGVKEKSVYQRAFPMHSPIKAIVIETIETVNQMFEKYGIVQDTLWDRNVALVGDTGVFHMSSKALFSRLDNRTVMDETRTEELPEELTSALRNALLDRQEAKSYYLEPYESKDCEVAPQEFSDWMGDISPAWLKEELTEGTAERLVTRAYLADVDGDGDVEGIQYVSEGGSSGSAQIILWEKKDGRSVLSFQMFVIDRSYMGLLGWNGQYYLVFSDYNLYSFEVESFHVISFSGQYPKEYTVSMESDGKDWQEVYYNEEINAAVMDSLRSYLKEIGPRLEEYTVPNDDCRIMYGQAEIPMAKDKERFHNFENWKTYCVVVDIDNDGAKERVEKEIRYPDSINSRLYLMTGFLKQYHTLVYRLGLIFPENYVEEVDSDLIQLWFDEIEGKVYTFQMLRFNASNDYVLNVSLLQGDELTPILQYLLIDRKVILFKRPLGPEEVYDLVEQGDLSVVTASERHMSYLKELHEGHHYEILWKRADITGDEVPELLCQEVFDSKKQPVNFIFTYRQGKAELIFVDLNDYSEYYFLGDGGNLVYDYTNFGIVDYGSYERVLFSDEKDADMEDYHIIIGQERIIVQFFDDWYDEEDTAYYKERYPDTYGTYGPGIYCYRETPTTQTDIRKQEWVREQITKEEFLEAYKEMTGFDFLTENRDWEYNWEKTFE